MKRNIRSMVGRALGYASLSLFGILMLSMLFPVTSSSSSALSNTDTATTTRVSVKAVETVSIRLASKVGLELTPSSQGSFGVADTELGVTTNDPEGYEVFLASTDHEAALRGVSDRIKTIDGDMVGSSFTGNTWGYSIGKEAVSATSTYSTVPTTTSSILKTETASIDTEEVYHLGFGVHITPSLPAGEYSSSVLLSVVANPATISSLSDLVYMQDMTSDICSNTYPTADDLATMTEAEEADAKLHPVTKRLYDVRDGKQYWVAKLADGNCWMVQNLALDLGTGDDPNLKYVAKLTPADSDVSEDWIPETSTNAEKLTGTEGEVSLKSEYSWNFGEIVLALPTKYAICGNYTAADSALSGDDLGVACRGSGAVNVSGAEWQPIFRSQAGIFNNENYNYVAIDETSKTYDAHYLIGNYYQYNTAPAGSANGLTELNRNAEDSICPRGWRLPTSGVSTNGSPIVNPNEPTGSFYQLLMAYGYEDNNFRDASDAIELVSLDLDDTRNVIAAPVYLARSGIISLKYGYLRQFGSHGYMVSSTTYNAGHALFLGFAGNITPASHDNKHYGYSVRCLAR